MLGSLLGTRHVGHIDSQSRRQVELMLLLLDQNPAGHEVVRQVLGHSSIQTTTRAYAGLEMEAAARHFGEKMMERRAASKAVREQRP